MTKQEFLAMSLPYGLTIQKSESYSTIKGIIGDAYCITDFPKFGMYGDCEDARIILYPLSDLTKEVEHNGEKFVPITEIQKRNDFIHIMNGSFVIGAQSVYELDELPTWVTQLLIKWHFDIADLISEGEAIDVNTLETNPYK